MRNLTTYSNSQSALPIQFFFAALCDTKSNSADRHDSIFAIEILSTLFLFVKFQSDPLGTRVFIRSARDVPVLAFDEAVCESSRFAFFPPAVS